MYVDLLQAGAAEDSEVDSVQVLDEPENEITITVFRLLVLDLLSLFQVLNQAMINILGAPLTPAVAIDLDGYEI
jgi:hypothetical protein